jgi:prepilin-type processing-associated H-X9-DG protein
MHMVDLHRDRKWKVSDMAINQAFHSARLARRTALTLFECLVALAIVATLIGLTVVAVQRSRATAARVQCAQRQRELALAVHNYESLHHKLPEGVWYPFLHTPSDITRQAGQSWQTAILPFVDQTMLWDMAWEAQCDDPITSCTPLHLFVAEQIIPSFLCPTERYQFGWNPANGQRWGVTSYLGVAGTNTQALDGVFGRNLAVHMVDITDGTSNTIMIGERPAGPDGLYAAWYAGWGNLASSVNFMLDAGYGHWSPTEASCRQASTTFRPGELDNLCDVNHFWSLHTGGANFAFADGSVRFIPYTSADILPALATRAGGEVVSLD